MMSKVVAILLGVLIGVAMAEPGPVFETMTSPEIIEGFIAEVTPVISDDFLPMYTPVPPEDDLLPDELDFDDRNVSIAIEMLTSMNELRYGEEVVLTCVVDGIPEPYAMSWEYSKDAETWHSLGWHFSEYRFILTPENVEYFYRVVVTI